MKDLVDQLMGKRAEPEPTCEGMLFRGRENTYLLRGDKTGLERRRRMQLLRRRSCPGCHHCFGLREAFEQDFEDIPLPDPFVSGGVYELTITAVTRDPESGIVDGCEAGFKLVEEG